MDVVLTNVNTIKTKSSLYIFKLTPVMKRRFGEVCKHFPFDFTCDYLAINNKNLWQLEDLVPQYLILLTSKTMCLNKSRPFSFVLHFSDDPDKPSVSTFVPYNVTMKNLFESRWRCLVLIFWEEINCFHTQYLWIHLS